MIDPQQEIFTLVKQMLESTFDKSNVYDGFMPDENTPYPFVYLADVFQVDDANKSAIFGKITLTVHVWHNNPQKRGTVSDMMLKVKRNAQKIKGKYYAWDYRNATQRIIHDNTTSQPLLHGVVELQFYFS